MLNYEVEIPQKKKFLTYTDGEDRTPILRKHEDKVIRTRDALKRAGIPFRESNGHSYDKDYKHIPRGFDRIEVFRTIFEYTVTPEHYINYVRESCRETQTMLKLLAEENDVFTRVSGYSSAREFACEVAKKAAEFVHSEKQRWPDFLNKRINCKTSSRVIAIGHDNEGYWDYVITFEQRGLKKLDSKEEQAMNDLVTIEICNALNALEEVDCVSVVPTGAPYDEDYLCSSVTVYYVLDEKNCKKGLSDWQ